MYNKNLFFYTDTDLSKDGAIRSSCFALNRVIRAAEFEPEKFIILLDDFHQEEIPVQKQVGKNGRTVIVKEKQTVNSHIYLNEADTIRFRQLTEVV